MSNICRPEEILVLAFNRAVVFEIRSRLRELFASLGYGSYIRRLRIHTFHAFAVMNVGRGDSPSNESHEPDHLENLAVWLHDPAHAYQAASGFRAILIDEFQDVNEHIFDILINLHQASGAGLFVIGDDDQDILRWNRKTNNTPSDSYFKQFCSMFGLDIHLQPALRVNFRSDVTIVERSQNLLTNFFKDYPSCRLKQGVELTSRKDAAPGTLDSIIKNDGILVSPRDETIRKAGEALAQRDSVAILCRTNAEVTEVYRKIVNEHPRLTLQTQTTYRIGQLRHLGAWLELCRETLRLEGDRLLVDEVKDSMWRRWKSLAIPEAQALRAGQISPLTLWDLTLDEQSYPHLSHHIRFLEHLESDEFWRMTGGNKGIRTAIVSTIHKVKGLEFDSVIIIPSSATFFADRRDTIEACAADEARLFYVGMTRAKHQLTIGFDKRERAWWSQETFAGKRSSGKVLEGRPKEVYISWSAKKTNNGPNFCAQDYIEHYVRMGDKIFVTAKNLYHVYNGKKTQVGCLRKEFYGDDNSIIEVAAVLRYPQQPDNDYWPGLTKKVQARGWTYIVLVSGFL